MRLNNLPSDGKAQARTSRFCRKKWLEQVLSHLSWDPLSLIFNADFDTVRTGTDRKAYFATVGHGFAGIAKKVENDLFDLPLIQVNLRELAGRIDFEMHTVSIELGTSQCSHLLDEIRRILLLEAKWLLSREREVERVPELLGSVLGLHSSHTLLFPPLPAGERGEQGG